MFLPVLGNVSPKFCLDRSDKRLGGDGMGAVGGRPRADRGRGAFVGGDGLNEAGWSA